MSTRQIFLSPDELAILRSVLYASLFEYPLTLPEVRETLPGRVLDEPAVLRTYLGSARLRRLVDYRDGFFFPRGRAGWMTERRRRRTISLALLEKNRRLLRVICAMPFVRLVALSGSIAALNAEPDADVDLFVVTKGRHAWTVTLAVVLLTKLVGRRRVICANFVMSDTEMRLEHQDVFDANQVVQLRPVLGEDAFRDFLAANPFVERCYPNFSVADRRGCLLVQSEATIRVKTALEAVLAVPSAFIERACRLVYGWHLRRQTVLWRTPREVRLLSDCLKLHTRSHRAAILGRFDWLCREALTGAPLAAGVMPAVEMLEEQAVNS